MPDKDDITQERRSGNVSSLRPQAKTDYFENSDMDERSHLMKRNVTKITKVRNTMAPVASAQPLGMHGGSHRLIPSKTPTLYGTKKRSQPFLNSDHQNHFEQHRNFMKNLEIDGYATSKGPENRSRTAFQNRI